MNVHLSFTTIPHPEDIASGVAEPHTSQWMCKPEDLAELIKGFVDRANKADIWKDRGSLLFMIQPVHTPPPGKTS